jgi:hypothetical protein
MDVKDLAGEAHGLFADSCYSSYLPTIETGFP